MLRTASTVRMLQALSLVVALAVLLLATGFPGAFKFAQAAALTNASDTLSESAPNVLSNHTIEFTTPNGLVSGQTIVLTFDGAFTFPGAGFDFNDIDLATTTDEVLGAAAGANVWGVATTSSTITLTTPTNYGVASATAITIEIGDNATFGATGNSQITNPVATSSYPIGITSGQDTGEVLVAIIESVTVSASIETVFDLTISGVASGATVNGSPTTTATGTTPTTLPFETVAQGTSKTLAHDISVVTNANDGFVVTVEQSSNLQSSTGADIDGFIDGAYTDTPAAWTSPSAVIGSENTYGHWAVTSDDTDFSATPDRWVAASTTPRVIFDHNDVANGSGVGEGTTRVGYQIQISPLQEAGNDYTTTLTYIATPTF